MFLSKINARYQIVSVEDTDAWDDDLLRAIYSYTEDHAGITAKEKEILKKGIQKHGIDKELYRGLNGDFSHLKVGDTITMSGFISCTDDEDVAYKFAKGKSLDQAHKAGAVITLTGRGLPITQGRFNDEAEHLVLGDGKYIVKEIDYQKRWNLYYITVD